MTYHTEQKQFKKRHFANENIQLQSKKKNVFRTQKHTSVKKT